METLTLKHVNIIMKDIKVYAVFVTVLTCIMTATDALTTSCSYVHEHVCMM